MKNENMMHGLFGKLEPGEVVQFENWKDVATHVYHLSKERKNIYRSILSFERETARELDLIKQSDWRKYIDAHVATLAENNGIKIENFRFACAVHDERHHPHMHIVFWDKQQEITKNYVPPSVPNNIRKQLIKDTFGYKIREFLAEKDESRQEIASVTDADVAGFEQYIKDIRPKEYAKAKDWFDTFNEDSIYSDPIYGLFNDKYMLPIISKLFQIKERIPPQGRIAYKLLPPDVKSEIDELVVMLLKGNAGLRRAVSRYVDSKMNLAKLYSSDGVYLKKQKKQFQKEAENIIAKRITATLKTLCKKERGIPFSEDEKRYHTEQLLVGLLEIFSRMASSDEKRFDGSHKAMSSELSKQALKELYLKMQDQGLEP